MIETSGPADLQNNRVCTSSFKKHWAEAQIDGPMHTIARYDDVSKLLITIGGFVLGALAAAFSTLLRDRNDQMTAIVKVSSVAILVLILLFFVFAVLVCYFQPKMWARQILEATDDSNLSCSIQEWCGDLQRVIFKKRLLLYLAMLFFAFSFLLMMSLLLRVL